MTNRIISLGVIQVNLSFSLSLPPDNPFKGPPPPQHTRVIRVEEIHKKSTCGRAGNLECQLMCVVWSITTAHGIRRIDLAFQCRIHIDLAFPCDIAKPQKSQNVPPPPPLSAGSLWSMLWLVSRETALQKLSFFPPHPLTILSGTPAKIPTVGPRDAKVVSGGVGE